MRRKGRRAVRRTPGGGGFRRGRTFGHRERVARVRPYGTAGRRAAHRLRAQGGSPCRQRRAEHRRETDRRPRHGGIRVCRGEGSSRGAAHLPAHRLSRRPEREPHGRVYRAGRRGPFAVRLPGQERFSARQGALHPRPALARRLPVRKHGHRRPVGPVQDRPLHRKGAENRAAGCRAFRRRAGPARREVLPAHVAEQQGAGLRCRDVRKDGRVRLCRRRLGAGHRRPVSVHERRQREDPRDRPRRIPAPADHRSLYGPQQGALHQRDGVDRRRAVGQRLHDRHDRAHRPADGRRDGDRRHERSALRGGRRCDDRRAQRNRLRCGERPHLRDREKLEHAVRNFDSQGLTPAPAGASGRRSFPAADA